MAKIYRDENIPPRREKSMEAGEKTAGRREREKDEKSGVQAGGQREKDAKSGEKTGDSLTGVRGRSVWNFISPEEIARRFTIREDELEKGRAGESSGQGISSPVPRTAQDNGDAWQGREAGEWGSRYAAFWAAAEKRESRYAASGPAAEEREGRYAAFREAVLKGEQPDERSTIRRQEYSSRLLLELIGARPGRRRADPLAPPARGLEILEHYGDRMDDGTSVSGFEPAFVTRAIQSYIVLHDLPRTAVQKHFSEELAEDELLLALICWTDASDEQLYAGVCRYGKLDTERSKFIRKEPQLMEAVLARVYRAWASWYAAENERNPGLEIAGPADSSVWLPYRGLLTRSMAQEQGYRRLSYSSYMIDTIRRYEYDGVKWKLRHPFPDLYGNMDMHRKLQELCRETERQLREAVHYPYRLKNKSEDEDLQSLVAGQIQACLQEREDAQRPHVTIDVGKLGAIRSDADYTFEQLVRGTEEGEILAAEGTAAEAAAGKTAVEAAAGQIAAVEKTAPGSTGQGEGPSSGGSLFTEEEVHFLKFLLEGDGAGALGYARSRHLITSILEDSINEKMLDLVGDSVIEDGDRGPEIVDDYLEDVKAATGRPL